jgi:penicillin-binding protein 1A
LDLSLKQAVDPKSAFILAHMMKGVVERGTARVVSSLGYPVGGKTGTTNNYMDTWFVGFTPRWVCGVWVGFDEKRKIGEKETGGSVSAPIFLAVMKEFLDMKARSDREGLTKELNNEASLLDIGPISIPEVQPFDFEPPPGVQGRWISRGTGRPAKEGEPGAVKGFFVSEGGSEDEVESPAQQRTVDEYFESSDL